jgi:glucokinase
MRIGIDLGGTNIAGGLVNDADKIVFITSLPTLAERTCEAVVDDIVRVIETLMKKAVEMGDAVVAIGIGVPGLVDGKGEVVLHLTNLNWDNVPLKKRIQEKVDLPVFIENDANAAAYAEWHSGALRDAEVAVLVTLGTGVGGGLIVGKKLYRGKRGVGELGHMTIQKDGRQCGCGLKGCFEAYASATGLVRTAQELMTEESEASQMRSASGLTPKMVIDFAKAGDRLALRAFDETMDYLAIGINNLINTLDPDSVAIGGGLAHAGDFLLDVVKDKVQKMAFAADLEPTPIRFAHYLNDAGIIGAALMTYQE